MIPRSQKRDLGITDLLTGRLLPRAFFEAPPEPVAPSLLGKLLVHKTGSGLLAGRIVEVSPWRVAEAPFIRQE